MTSADPAKDPSRQARVLLPFRLDLARTLAAYRYGTGDPAYAVIAGSIWRAMVTEQGPATARFTVRHAGPSGSEVVIEAWGAGRDWVLDHARNLIGGADRADDFAPEHPLVRQLATRFGGVRIARSGLVLESLIPAVLSQKITGKEAFGSWRRLLRRHGIAAPGPTPVPMHAPPPAETIRSLDDAAWHALGVDRAHRETIRRVAARASALERLLEREPDDAEQRMRSLRGIGVWTAAETIERAWGSADHPSFGDYHVPSSVGIALAGEPVDDAGMASLLEPFRPHRGRVVRLIELAGIARPRRGPRRTVPDYRAI